MSKVSGKKVKVYFKDKDTKKILGGQKNATLNRSKETIDATTKDTEGDWKESLPGFKEWSIDCDGAYIADDEAYDILEDAFMNDDDIEVVVEFASGKTYSGKTVLTDFPLEFPYDDLVTYSISLQGTGALAKGTVSPALAKGTVSPA